MRRCWKNGVTLPSLSRCYQNFNLTAAQTWIQWPRHASELIYFIRRTVAGRLILMSYCQLGISLAWQQTWMVFFTNRYFRSKRQHRGLLESGQNILINVYKFAVRFCKLLTAKEARTVNWGSSRARAPANSTWLSAQAPRGRAPRPCAHGPKSFVSASHSCQAPMLTTWTADEEASNQRQNKSGRTRSPEIQLSKHSIWCQGFNDAGGSRSTYRIAAAKGRTRAERRQAPMQRVQIANRNQLAAY